MMNLPYASRLANRIVAGLSLFCKRIEIAGSIRRKRHVIGDIDLVIIADPDQRQHILDRLKQNCTIRTGDFPTASNTISILQSDIQVDCFFAREASQDFFDKIPSNFGSLFLCRTASKEHNITLAAAAKAKGWHWDMYRGMLDASGRIIAGETEASIFDVLSLPWLDPEQREV